MLPVSCTGNMSTLPSYISKISIPNWNEIYPSLEIEAQKWDPEAGLHIAVLRADSSNSIDLPLLHAIFESPNNRLEFLHIKVFENQVLDKEIINRLIPSLNSNLIFDSDWELNSKDAWILFLENPEITSFNEKYFNCATLTLINKEIDGKDKKIVIWQLALDDCLGKSTLYFIDAKTSEFLGSESH